MKGHQERRGKGKGVRRRARKMEMDVGRKGVDKGRLELFRFSYTDPIVLVRHFFTSGHSPKTGADRNHVKIYVHEKK
jgi:hypothetical protein